MTQWQHNFTMRGFTLIELAMVIAILGILAAVAVPRFHDLRAETRAARVDAMLGTLRAASAIAHAAYLINGSRPARVSAEGISVALVNGYPAAATAGIVAAARLAEAANILTTTHVGGSVSIDIADGVAGRCGVNYTEASADGAPPTIVAEKSGC